MAYEEDDVLTTRESQPVTITLLIVGCLALLAAIIVSVKQLGVYVNADTRSQLSNFTITAVQLAEREMPEDPDAELSPEAEQSY